MIISINVIKAFEKIQHVFLIFIKSFNKIGIKRYYFIMQNPRIMCKWKSGRFLLKSEQGKTHSHECYLSWSGGVLQPSRGEK